MMCSHWWGCVQGGCRLRCGPAGAAGRSSDASARPRGRPWCFHKPCSNLLGKDSLCMLMIVKLFWIQTPFPNLECAVCVRVCTVIKWFFTHLFFPKLRSVLIQLWLHYSVIYWCYNWLRNAYHCPFCKGSFTVNRILVQNDQLEIKKRFCYSKGATTVPGRRWCVPSMFTWPKITM